MDRRSMFSRLSVLAAVAMLAGCAAMVPGYTPPDLEKPNKAFKATEIGRVGPSGRYEMSNDEKAIDCNHLTGSMLITIARLKDANYLHEASTLSSVASNIWQNPIMGGAPVVTNRNAEYNRELAKLEAYNEHLAAQNCKTVDIQAELARPPELDKKY